MSSDIDKLKELGAQKIYEQTHVSKEHIQAILHNSFEDLNKVQIIGFISILEREYKVDLSETRESANNYFAQLPVDEEHNKEIFVAVREKKSNNTTIYVVIIAIIIMIALYFSLKNSTIVSDEKIDNALIEDVKEKMLKDEIVKKEDNVSKIIVKKEDLNITKVVVKEKSKEVTKVTTQIKQQKKVETKSFKIFPKSKVWIGYINISNNKHFQKVVKGSLELDANKDWLLLLGHNQVRFELNGKKQTMKDSIRFLYIDSKLKAITLQEFKKLNKGSKW